MKINFILAWLRAQLIASPEVNNLLEGRIYPDKAPRGTKNPCLIYQMIGSEFEEYLDDDEVTDIDLTIQLRMYTDSRLETNDLRESIKTILTDNQCGVKSITIKGVDHEFRITRSKMSGFEDTITEGSSPNDDDYGAVCVWEIDATE